jgi:glycine/D-amino acid oxidase-like deaminating enzyme
MFAGDRAMGVRLASGQEVAAGAILIAAGPWSIDLVPGWLERPPIGRSWGVVATIALKSPPRRILEEMTIAAHGPVEPSAFSLITAAGSSSLGSTSTADQPDPSTTAQRLVEHGARFVRAVASAPVTGTRVCARPVSFDGRPLIGQVNGYERLFVCAGHGPWGISTGPGSAARVVDMILGRGGESLSAELAASRH